jgi:hypothetical protein
MGEQSFDTRRMTRDHESHVAAATAIGVNAVKPVLQFQVALLRLWADNIEAFARKYEKWTQRRGRTAGEAATGGLTGCGHHSPRVLHTETRAEIRTSP